MKLQLPLTKDVISKLKIGDVVELTGYLYTARDAAHKKIVDSIAKGEDLPIDLKNQTIFYSGPCPAKPGSVIGPIGPTTSVRMDPFVETFLEQGITAMIGKGDRSNYVAPLLKEHKAVYLLGIGGASALIAQCIKEVEVVAYEELGTESLKKLYVEDFKVIVGIDTEGRILHDEGISQYKNK